MVRKAVTTLAIAFASATATAAAMDKRLVNGEEAKPGDFPFIVSIGSTPSGKSHSCAGSLLDDITVLTAGHCVAGAYYVRAGTQDLGEAADVAEVAYVKAHPDYNLTTKGADYYTVNDIGIVKLSTPINRSDKIEYATLPKDGWHPAVKSTGRTAGWGPTSSGKGSPTAVDHLRVLDIPVRPLEECQRYSLVPGNRDTIICAGGDGKITTRYDSGGPLIDKETGYLSGVVSQAMSDAQFPGAFTNVGSYMSFIEEYRGSNGRPDPNAPSRVKLLQEAAKKSKVISEDEVFEHCDRTGQSRQDCYEAKKPCDTQRRKKPNQTHEEYFQCIDEEVIKWLKFLGEYDDQGNKKVQG